MDYKEEKLLSIKGVMDYVQMSDSKIYDLVKKKAFPLPYKHGGNSLWSLAEIQAWIDDFKKAEDEKKQLKAS